MFWKNATPYDLLTKFPVRYKLDIIAFFRALLTFNYGEAGAILRAHYHFWKRFSVYNNRRQHLLSRRTNTDNPITLLPISIIWQYYVRHRRTFDELKHPEHE
jgi:hypothetical protein